MPSRRHTGDKSRYGPEHPDGSCWTSGIARSSCPRRPPTCRAPPSVDDAMRPTAAGESTVKAGRASDSSCDDAVPPVDVSLLPELEPVPRWRVPRGEVVRAVEYCIGQGAGLEDRRRVRRPRQTELRGSRAIATTAPAVVTEFQRLGPRDERRDGRQRIDGLGSRRAGGRTAVRSAGIRRRRRGGRRADASGQCEHERERGGGEGAGAEGSGHRAPGRWAAAPYRCLNDHASGATPGGAAPHHDSVSEAVVRFGYPTQLVSSGGSVAATTSSTVTPGASSTSTRPVGRHVDHGEVGDDAVDDAPAGERQRALVDDLRPSRPARRAP